MSIKLMNPLVRLVARNPAQVRAFATQLGDAPTRPRVKKDTSLKIEKDPKLKKLKAVAVPPVQRATKQPPKGGVSAYTLFIKNYASERKAAGERFALTDAIEAYKKMPEEEKAKLLEQVPNVLAERKKLYDAFVNNMSPAEIAAENKVRAGLRKTALAKGKSVSSKLKKIKDPNAPTAPLSAWMRFLQERRSSGAYEDLPMIEITKRASTEWRELSDEARAKYSEEAAKGYEAYKKAKDAYYGQQ
ncbi:high mobility group box domain-containing protein [Protomyces lactucae-debilis]|uniref:High mobility group box domain-containing protein n=1 Tax=Protomyces lactucae-debilis TaxID=2754530 RepID=A0A1Y2EYH8_PROLT|nr:high mobility group box domain-containing protein [Protomyces lactucae-debilis]ORY76659.1 high mobility group box domain-containing protein [Protomyces lactucae-debilis]